MVGGWSRSSTVRSRRRTLGVRLPGLCRSNLQADPHPRPRRRRRASENAAPARGPRPPAQQPVQRSNGCRPQQHRAIAGAPRPSRVLALTLIGGALWLINEIFQPFHDEGPAPSVTVPEGATPARSASASQEAEVIEDARAFEPTRPSRCGAAAPPRPVHPRPRDEQRRRHRGAHAGSRRPVIGLHVPAPQGPLDPRGHAARRQRLSTALRERDHVGRSTLRRAGALGSRGRRTRSSLPVPATYVLVTERRRDLVKRRSPRTAERGQVSMTATRAT